MKIFKIKLLFAFLMYAQLAVGQPYFKADFNGPYSRITLHATGKVYTEPIMLLHNYRDGGMDNDGAVPQVDFKAETKAMLDKTESNIDARIKELNAKYQQLYHDVQNGMPSIVIENEKYKNKANVLNVQLSRISQKPDLFVTVTQQIALQRYLEQVFSLKEATNKELTKILEKQQISQQFLGDLRKLREELLSDQQWHSSDAALAVGVLAYNTLATSNLIYDLLGINPALENNPLIFSLTTFKETFQESIISGQLNYAEVRDAFILARAKDAAKPGDLIKVADAMATLAQTMKKMTELPEDHAALKQEVRDQLDAIDRQIGLYQQNNQRSEEVIALHRYILKAIDDYIKLNQIDDQFRMDVIPMPNLPLEHIRPKGYDLKGIELREPLYKNFNPLKAELLFEQHKQNSDYPKISRRYASFVEAGKADPVFIKPDHLSENERTARLSLQYANLLLEQLNEPEESKVAVSVDQVRELLNHAKTSRYVAMNYMPSKKVAGFSLFPDGFITQEMDQVQAEMKKLSVVLPDTNVVYTSMALNRIYKVNQRLFQNEKGDWLSGRELGARTAIAADFHYLGTAEQQKTLDVAAYLSTSGKPVIAVCTNAEGIVTIGMVLPGLNVEKSGSEKWSSGILADYKSASGGIGTTFLNKFHDVKESAILLFCLDKMPQNLPF